MKVLFLQEHVRENHMKRSPHGDWYNAFFQTKAGKTLQSLVEKGLELQKDQYYTDYAYNQVPKVVKRDKFNNALKYKPPTQAEASEEYKFLREKIVREKPDIIIPSGNIGCKGLLGVSSITKLRGIPKKVTIESEVTESKDVEPKEVDHEKIAILEENLHRLSEHLEALNNAYPEGKRTQGTVKESANIESEIERLKQEIISERGSESALTDSSNEHTCWVLPMFSMEYMFSNPKITNLVEADFTTLHKFVQQGEQAFIAKPVEYEHVTDIERVREIFTKDVKEAKVVAWDLETNTLKAEQKGAKPLVISLCCEEQKGITIPLEHKEFTWMPALLDEIYALITDFMADASIIKVGHNLRFDKKFLRLTKGITVFNNHRDTMIMYYLLINQDAEQSLKLSDMSYELTDMGGYDAPLEEFKVRYQQEYLEAEKNRIEALKLQHKREENKRKLECKAHDRRFRPNKKTFGTAEKKINEVDGSNFNYEWIPLVSFLSPYASGDVDACLRIHNKLEALAMQEGNEAIRVLYEQHYTELSSYLSKIEANGVKMDTVYNDSLQEAYQVEEDRLVEEARKYDAVKQLEAEYRQFYQKGLEQWALPKAQRNEEVAKLRDRYKTKLKFNPNAPIDKQRVLYDILGITLPFNKEFLVDSAVEDDVPEEEIEYYHYKANKKALEYIKDNFEGENKELAEILLTHSLVKTRNKGYTYKLRGLIDHNELLHGGFLPTGTATTRLSSRDPNLQQIPSKTSNVDRFDYKHPIKRQFITSFEGGALLQLDYSSLESRILALAAGDEEMTQAFLDGADLHKETATFVYGVAIDQVTKEQRQMAKAVTFGLAYGETPFSFAPKHNMDVKEAEVIFDKYFKNKPRVKAFIDNTHKEILKQGYVECLHGFRRNLRDVYSSENSKKNEAFRQSVNTKIQGSGAFLTNNSVIHIQKILEKYNFRSKMVLTVHDSIVIDCPPEEIHKVAQIAKYVMENLPIDWLFIDWKGEKLRYPIAADVEIGVNYNDMVAYDKELLQSFSSVKGYCKYKGDLKRIEDTFESKKITEEKKDQLSDIISSKIDIYKAVPA